MPRTKFNKVLLAASAMFLLAGCDVEAKPSYGDKDFLIGGTAHDGSKVEDITNNLRTLVYDQLYENGSINSAVLNEVIFYLAEEQIGSYETLKASTNEADVKLVTEIKGRMNEKLYAAVSTGSYDYRNKFNEEKFVKTIQQNLTYQIADESSTFSTGYVFLKDSDMHLYKGGADRDGVEYTADKREPNVGKYVLNCDYTRYMEDTYLEDVYRELLVEKYVKDEELDSFGKSAARKIRYVAIAENENHPEAAASLIKTFVKDYISAGKEIDLTLLEDAWKGINLSKEAEVLLSAAEIKTEDYDHTLFGDIMARYNKINDDELLTDASAESEFTNSGAYSKETGLELKTIELLKKELSNDGWFVKSNDSLSLPSSITSRLFDVTVANNVNNNLKNSAEDKANKFVKNVNGTYYLRPESIENKAEENMDCVIYDSSSKTYYIVIIDEAINNRKLGESKDATNYTEEMYEEAIYEIAQKYASRETYKNKALVHYLEEANIEFHDTAVYEYFKSTYPDVWDNED
ncbi:MAG: hypothetical protein J1F32_00140 [Erysipelotrichales bacterium]|nr:hypothetical protein [Erysipelotrichales bacterium]